MCTVYALCFNHITEMNSTDRLSTSIVDKNDRYELDSTVQIGTVARVRVLYILHDACYI